MLEGISVTSLIVFVTILLLVLLLLTLFALLVYSGLFHPIEDIGTGKPPIGQMIIAYKFARGPYNQSGQLFTEAAIIAPDNKAVGIYYDAPCKVEASQLRYVVGSILSEGSEPVDEDMVKRFTEKGFKILHLPEVEYVVKTQFPHITTMSIFIAVYKAYKNLRCYISDRKLCAHPFIEYYDGKNIHFLAPLSKQDEFYVPECEGQDDGGGDQATTDVDSMNTTASTVGDSQVSQDITQTTVDEETEQDSPDKETEGSATDGKDEEINKNDSAIDPDRDGERDTNDDEPASDDSTSSFEVLKSEHAE